MTRGQAWVGMACLVGACWVEEELIDDTFTEAEWAFLQTFVPPPPELCPPQLVGDASRCVIAAGLGRAMFFDRAVSGPLDFSANPALADDPSAPGAHGEVGTIACADCHDPKSFFVDTKSRPSNLSFGAKGRTRHNALSPVNVSLKGVLARDNCEREGDDFECGLVFSWTGKYPTAGQVLQLAGAGAMNTRGERLSQVIRGNGDYEQRYVELFDAHPPDCDASGACGCPMNPDGKPCHSTAQVFDNVSLLFETYLLQLTSLDSGFDCYITSEVVDGRTRRACVTNAGKPDEQEFGAAERRGLKLFLGKAMCVDCHHGPLLSDLKFHNTGVAQSGPNVIASDPGFGGEAFPELGIEVPDTRLGEFLTPPLRHVAKTAPYMHAGQHATLADVIEFYRRGGDRQGFAGIKDARIQALEITDDEARDLEAFLHTLTGTTETLEGWSLPFPPVTP